MSVFISYRREGGFETARHLYDRLSQDGYIVFFDKRSIGQGPFPQQIVEAIYKCDDFIVILDPACFDRMYQPDYNQCEDWVTIEILHAFLLQKNVIPIIKNDFMYPRIEQIPSLGFQFQDGKRISLKDIFFKLSRINSLMYNQDYFDAFYDNVRKSLQSTLRDSSSHEDLGLLEGINTGLNRFNDFCDTVRRTKDNFQSLLEYAGDALSFFDDTETDVNQEAE